MESAIIHVDAILSKVVAPGLSRIEIPRIEQPARAGDRMHGYVLVHPSYGLSSFDCKVARTVSGVALDRGWLETPLTNVNGESTTIPATPDIRLMM